MNWLGEVTVSKNKRRWQVQAQKRQQQEFFAKQRTIRTASRLLKGSPHSDSGRHRVNQDLISLHTVSNLYDGNKQAIKKVAEKKVIKVDMDSMEKMTPGLKRKIKEVDMGPVSPLKKAYRLPSSDSHTEKISSMVHRNTQGPPKLKDKWKSTLFGADHDLQTTPALSSSRIFSSQEFITPASQILGSRRSLGVDHSFRLQNSSDSDLPNRFSSKLVTPVPKFPASTSFQSHATRQTNHVGTSHNTAPSRRHFWEQETPVILGRKPIKDDPDHHGNHAEPTNRWPSFLQPESVIPSKNPQPLRSGFSEAFQATPIKKYIPRDDYIEKQCKQKQKREKLMKKYSNSSNHGNSSREAFTHMYKNEREVSSLEYLDDKIYNRIAQPLNLGPQTQDKENDAGGNRGDKVVAEAPAASSRLTGGMGDIGVSMPRMAREAPMQARLPMQAASQHTDLMESRTNQLEPVKTAIGIEKLVSLPAISTPSVSTTQVIIADTNVAFKAPRRYKHKLTELLMATPRTSSAAKSEAPTAITERQPCTSEAESMHTPKMKLLSPPPRVQTRPQTDLCLVSSLLADATPCKVQKLAENCKSGTAMVQEVLWPSETPKGHQTANDTPVMSSSSISTDAYAEVMSLSEEQESMQDSLIDECGEEVLPAKISNPDHVTEIVAWSILEDILNAVMIKSSTSAADRTLERTPDQVEQLALDQKPLSSQHTAELSKAGTKSINNNTPKPTRDSAAADLVTATIPLDLGCSETLDSGDESKVVPSAPTSPSGSVTISVPEPGTPCTGRVEASTQVASVATVDKGMQCTLLVERTVQHVHQYVETDAVFYSDAAVQCDSEMATTGAQTEQPQIPRVEMVSIALSPIIMPRAIGRVLNRTAEVTVTMESRGEESRSSAEVCCAAESNQKMNLLKELESTTTDTMPGDFNAGNDLALGTGDSSSVQGLACVRDSQVEGQSSEDSQVKGQSSEDSQVKGQSAEDSQVKGQSSEDSQVKGQSAEDSQVKGQSAADSQVKGQSAEDSHVKGQSAEDSQVKGQSAEVKGQSAEDSQVKGQSAGDSQVNGQSAEDSQVNGLSAEDSQVNGQSSQVKGQSADDSQMKGQSADESQVNGQSQQDYSHGQSAEETILLVPTLPEPHLPASVHDLPEIVITPSSPDISQSTTATDGEEYFTASETEDDDQQPQDMIPADMELSSGSIDNGVRLSEGTCETKASKAEDTDPDKLKNKSPTDVTITDHEMDSTNEKPIAVSSVNDQQKATAEHTDNGEQLLENNGTPSGKQTCGNQPLVVCETPPRKMRCLHVEAQLPKTEVSSGNEAAESQPLSARVTRYKLRGRHGK